MKKNFTIDLQIYSPEALLQSVEDFQDVVAIEFMNNEIVIDADNEEEIQEIFHEFMNYVL